MVFLSLAVAKISNNSAKCATAPLAAATKKLSGSSAFSYKDIASFIIFFDSLARMWSELYFAGTYNSWAAGWLHSISPIIDPLSGGGTLSNFSTIDLILSKDWSSRPDIYSLMGTRVGSDILPGVRFI